ncbi:hypothetical protein L3X38_043048 [Prunus dulcis]|uniref:Integrase catalytic domain-containing protein n=1 Tax=Prunus dulcis TaxID=3755 RepID=A0AAD4UXP6_PRUDU|nr:hypothetical protein L3X38_043048 [Prunus dulcis]
MKDLEPIHYFLGMEILHTPNGLSLTQSKYIKDLLTHTKMQDAKHISSPVASGRRLSLHDGAPLDDPSEYRSVVVLHQQCCRRSFSLRSELFRTARGDSSVADYLDKVNAIVDNLALSGSPLPDSDLLAVIMNNVRPLYESTVASAQAPETPITYADLEALLLSAEQRHLALHAPARDGPAAAMVAAHGRAPSHGRGRGSGCFPFRGGHSGGSAPWSGSSSTTRHPGFCGSSSSHGYGRAFSSSSSGSSLQPSVLGPHHAAAAYFSSPSAPFSSSRIQCQICGRYGHSALDYYNHLNLSYEGRVPTQHLTAMTAQQSSSPRPPNWVVDTGANSHITNDLSNLSLSREYHGHDSVDGVLGGTGLPITHIGSSSLPLNNSIFSLTDILHCPTASCNLLSVNKFSRDNNCFFTFYPNHFLVQDSRMGKTLFRGTSNLGLYSLPSSMSSHGRLAYLGVRVDGPVWHSRLRKSVKLPFQSSLSVSHAPLALIHSDVWSSSNKSVFGFQYYVLFVDNFSRYSWIFPMRLKYEVFSLFVKFKSLVENLFSTKIKALQTDGGGEYTSHIFHNFLVTHGIDHRISCPHHPEQNGLAEQKHRHIVDTGLTLLAHASMPPAYWAEAMHTIVYLINRLPSKVLGLQSPCQILLHKEPNFTFLKIFGCACFPHLRPYNTNKLHLRSVKCVFLGYSLDHQGYRCLNLTTNRVFLSRHVIFDEHCFPFQETKGPHAPISSSSSTDSAPPLQIFGSLPNQLAASQPHGHQIVMPISPNPSSPLPTHISSGPHLSSPLTNTTSNPIAVASQTIQHSPPSSLQVYCCTPHSTVLTFPSPDPKPVLLSSSRHSSPSATSWVRPSTTHSMVTRAKTGVRKPNPKYANHAFLASTNDIVEPTCFSQANKFQEWRTAMGEECNALQQAGTWVLVPPKPTLNILLNKWVFRIKHNSDGSVQRYKARLVANGFHQQERLDYGETFSPVVNHSTIRLILALSTRLSVGRLECFPPRLSK